MADRIEHLSDAEIKLECIRIAVEFAPDQVRVDPMDNAQKYYNWVTNKKNSARQPTKKASLNKDQL
jgi:hypothetical protein